MIFLHRDEQMPPFLHFINEKPPHWGSLAWCYIINCIVVGKFYTNLRGKMNKMLYLCRPIGYIHLEATKKTRKNGQI